MSSLTTWMIFITHYLIHHFFFTHNPLHNIFITHNPLHNIFITHNPLHNISITKYLIHHLLPDISYFHHTLPDTFITLHLIYHISVHHSIFDNIFSPLIDRCILFPSFITEFTIFSPPFYLCRRSSLRPHGHHSHCPLHHPWSSGERHTLERWW